MTDIPIRGQTDAIRHQLSTDCTDFDLPQNVSVEVVELEELTEEEQRDRSHLERKVERAFYEAGKALMELRDRRLYGIEPSFLKSPF
ncbi:hypothetical protein [Fischerella sp. PCC 9605]|uniref:hypothetical protein n=1 Tax=Fischerella sp. PCC 9605 TaxID=1173024 RepID=UPI00047A9E8F|nr:hypothetical protein [Fischerella sp. PCC 9605]